MFHIHAHDIHLRNMYTCTPPTPDASVLGNSEVAGGACFCSLLFKLHGPGLDTSCIVTTSSTLETRAIHRLHAIQDSTCTPNMMKHLFRSWRGRSLAGRVTASLGRDDETTVSSWRRHRSTASYVCLLVASLSCILSPVCNMIVLFNFN